MMFSPASAVISQVEAGSLRVLASAAAKRPGILPNVPTMAEAGMPDFDTSIWFGLMAPAGTPRDIIDKLATRGPRGGGVERGGDRLAPARHRGAERRSGRIRPLRREREQALGRGRPGGRLERNNANEACRCCRRIGGNAHPAGAGTVERLSLLEYDTGGYLARWFEGTLEVSRSTRLTACFWSALARPDFWPAVAVQRR